MRRRRSCPRTRTWKAIHAGSARNWACSSPNRIAATLPSSSSATANIRPTKSSPSLRHTFNQQFPAFHWEFPGILGDVIGDLQLTPDPVEIKLFSPDLNWLMQVAPRVEEEIKKIPGIVDTFDGLTETGPSINFRVRPADAARFGLRVEDIAVRGKYGTAWPDCVLCPGRRPRRQHSRSG